MKPETVAAFAVMVGGEVHGDADRRVTGVADLRVAGPEHLGFLADKNLLPAARVTRAAGLLVAAPIETPAAQIVVPDVYAAFAKVALFFHPVPRATEHSVHPSAVVDPSAVLHEPVQVGAHASVGPRTTVGAGSILEAGVAVGADCRIGADCVLRANVTLSRDVQLGQRVILHSGTVVGADGFGYAREPSGTYIKFPQVGTVEIGDDVEVGANCAIDRGALGATRIGRGSKIDNLVHIAHNCNFGENVAVAGFSAFSGGTVLEDGVVIAGHTVLAGHLRIAAGVRVGGASVITHDVLEPGDYMGYPLLPKTRWIRLLRALRRLVGPNARRDKA